MSYTVGLLLVISFPTFQLLLKSPLYLLVFFLAPFSCLLSSALSDFFFFSQLHFLQFPYLSPSFQYFSACTIDYEQETQTCKGSTPPYPSECNQMTKEDVVVGWGAKKKTKKKMATNEVLSEINNAACTVLKDFSKGGVFLYRPQQKCGVGWVGRWVGGGPTLLG